MFPDFARRSVDDLLSERIKFLEAQILGLEKDLEGAKSEREFALGALKDWRRSMAAAASTERRTIKQSVLEIMGGSKQGWSQGELRQQALERFNHVISSASLPAQMQRLSEAGLIRRSGDRWYDQTGETIN
ncbi:hypothetical protein ABIB57_001949 [Devosia sp. UYZn731]|uniref:hypothetical protein n=1 Tax=Devosia sp. UYZn731 TaxID=3156345 RepID=UPI0033924B44